MYLPRPFCSVFLYWVLTGIQIKQSQLKVKQIDIFSIYLILFIEQPNAFVSLTLIGDEDKTA